MDTETALMIAIREDDWKNLTLELNRLKGLRDETKDKIRLGEYDRVITSVISEMGALEKWLVDHNAPGWEST